MGLITMPEHTMTRRKAVATIGGATVAGVGGAFGLSRYAVTPAQAQVNVTFEDTSVVLDRGENVGEVYVTGSLTGDYGAPDDNAQRALMDISIRHTGGDTPDPPSATIEDEREYDVDPSGGTIEDEFEYPLVERAGIPRTWFDPTVIERSPEQEFLLNVSFRVMSESRQLAVDDSQGQATVTVETQGFGNSDGNGNNSDNGGGNQSASATVTGDFSFRVERS